MTKPMWFVIAAILCAVGMAASAQEWNYMSYNANGKPAIPGYLKLTESSPGKFKARLVMPADFCWQTELEAVVTEEPDQKIIIMEPRTGGCPELRFVLKADGSAGQRQVRGADGAWVWDRTERGLDRRP